MNFMDAVKAGINNYANFNGRASRSEFWWWTLFQIIALFALGAISGVLASVLGPAAMALYVLGAIALFLPSLAVAVRRLHDLDKSGWMMLISLIPLVGLLVLFWYASAGTTGANRFGDDPLGNEDIVAA